MRLRATATNTSTPAPIAENPRARQRGEQRRRSSGTPRRPATAASNPSPRASAACRHSTPIRLIARDGVAEDERHRHRPARWRASLRLTNGPYGEARGIERLPEPVEQRRRGRALHDHERRQPETEPGDAARHRADAAAARRSSARRRRGRQRGRRARAPTRSIQRRATAAARQGTGGAASSCSARIDLVPRAARRDSRADADSGINCAPATARQAEERRSRKRQGRRGRCAADRSASSTATPADQAERWSSGRRRRTRTASSR